MSQTNPLSGIRVLDLTHYIAGPYCTKLFADLGADVIKIEKPGQGDGARGLHPFIGSEPHPEKSATFLYLNTNKRSVCLDLKGEEGRRKFKDLAASADIVVENFRPGVMAGLGLGYQNLARIHPGLVMTSISNFGQFGPYRDWQGTELTLSALAGMMYMTGVKDREPVKLGLSQLQYTAGVAAAVATLAAYRQRQLSGYGQWVDVSIVEPMINTIHQQTARYAYWGSIEQRGANADFPFFVETENGWLHISPLWMQDLIDFVGLPELDDEKFKDLVQLRQNASKFKDLILPWFRAKDGFELFHSAQERGIPWAPVHDEAAILSCPQLEARDYFLEIEHPVAGKARYPGRYFYSEQIEKFRGRPAPLLGQHTKEVLEGIEGQKTRREGQALSQSSDFHKHSPLIPPLAGIRVLSTEHWAALPHATKYLASLGAQIITVESHNHSFHGLEAKNTIAGGGLYQEGARNKISITLDMSKPRGAEIFKRLVQISDVVADNFSPRVMKNLGLDYAALKAVKQDIIVVSLSGYGHKGPWNLYRGYALTSEAAGGVVNFTGYADGPPTRPGGTPFGDIIPALHAAWTILAALEYHDRTGEGAFIDMGMLEPGIGQLGEAIVHYSLTGQAIPRMGNRDPNAAPSGCYPCQGQDKWITIAAVTEKQWQALVKVMGHPSWAEEDRYGSKERRLKNQDSLDERLKAWTADQDFMEIMKRCQEAGVPAGAVLNVREVMTNEHYMARGTFEVVQHPQPPQGVGNRLHIGPPWKLSRTGASTLVPASDRFGRDNDDVYRSLLGLSDEELTELTKEGVIGTELTSESREILINPAYFGPRDEDFMEILGLK